MALVDVDDDDPVGGPAQCDRPPTQVVLAAGRFGVVDDLIQRGVAHVQVGVAAQVRGGDFGRTLAACVPQLRADSGHTIG